MILKSFKDIPTTIQAEVRDGSLISLDETEVAEKALGRKVEWQEVEGSRQTAGKYFQCLYETTLPNSDSYVARQAIDKYRQNFDV